MRWRVRVSPPRRQLLRGDVCEEVLHHRLPVGTRRKDFHESRRLKGEDGLVIGLGVVVVVVGQPGWVVGLLLFKGRLSEPLGLQSPRSVQVHPLDHRRCGQAPQRSFHRSGESLHEIRNSGGIHPSRALLHRPLPQQPPFELVQHVPHLSATMHAMYRHLGPP